MHGGEGASWMPECVMSDKSCCIKDAASQMSSSGTKLCPADRLSKKMGSNFHGDLPTGDNICIKTGTIM
eukprot:1897069-Karenia_brevis.AAC.1